jgi:hypothetical protein
VGSVDGQLFGVPVITQPLRYYPTIDFDDITRSGGNYMSDHLQRLREKLISIRDIGDSGESDPSNLPIHRQTSIRNQLEEIAVEILQIVGHDQDNIFVDIEYETPSSAREEIDQHLLHFPAIAAKTAASPPHVAIAVKSDKLVASDLDEPMELRGLTSKYILSYDVTSRASVTVLLSRNAIAILGQEYPGKIYPLSHFSKDHAKEISNQISPPEEYPEGRSGKFPAGHHPQQTKLTRWLFADSDVTPGYQAEISTEYFQLDIERYSELLYNAYKADSNQSKGSTLEDVAEYLFEGISLVSVKDRNLHRKSDEIDLVLQYTGGPSPNLFEYYSRYVLVECKNVDGSVSSKEVGHFQTKLSNTNCNIGILIAWDGISGQETGEYAQRYVDSSDSDIIVLTSDDLYDILDGKSLYEIIDKRLYELRFDLGQK